MPEMTFTVRWPDGAVEDCYSPSLVVHDHLDVGGTYAVPEFVDRCRTALGIASDRVRAKYGFACTASAASLDRIVSTAGRHSDRGVVEVLTMHPDLPKESS
ncbi:MSMEG_0570 family nitrogen starvation response protein [Aeromicrobium alkaliterrae]|uniref:MSMEG_0570 family nitrogen starvation response protein n=1 Tax=Aeromicrobium alkaliterrae TaxID=302168 RepID=A0ABN2K2D2_9ACTN